MVNIKRREKEVKKVLWITLFLNLLVSITKLVAGQAFGYLSLTSSGLESLFDGSANVLALVSIHFASQPPDKEHNYGHYKFENLGSLIIALLLIFSAYQLGSQVFAEWGVSRPSRSFDIIPIGAILFSMGVSLFTTLYESKKGEELKSSLLKADSDHTMGDFLISFGVVISILATNWGIWWIDWLMGAVISLYLVLLALKIVKRNLPDLLDASPDIRHSLVAQVTEMDRVIDIHRFRARGNEHWMQVDFHLHLEPQLSLIEAHQVAKRVEEKVQEILKDVSQQVEVMVHIEPFTAEHEPSEPLVVGDDETAHEIVQEKNGSSKDSGEK